MPRVEQKGVKIGLGKKKALWNSEVCDLLCLHVYIHTKLNLKYSSFYQWHFFLILDTKSCGNFVK
jgi:hypothetical protein